MEKLEKAKALLTKSMNAEALRKLDQLERQAEGKEKMYIAALWDAALALAEPMDLHLVHEEYAC